MHPPQKISLVLSDVDGTLVNADKVLTPRAQQAVHRLRDANIRFAITSGRPPRGMEMLIEPLQLDTPIAGFNGGMFMNAQREFFEEKTLPEDVVGEAIELIRSHGLEPWVYSGNAWFVPAWDGAHVRHESSTVQFAPSVVTDFGTAIQGAIKVVGVSDDLDAVERCTTASKAVFGQRVSASRSQPYYLDITHRDANKGAVAEYLAGVLGIPFEEILTIGDGLNDVLMFRKSGFSIAMGNAAEAVKSVASATTDSHANEGFAKAIEQFVLGEDFIRQANPESRFASE